MRIKTFVSTALVGAGTLALSGVAHAGLAVTIGSPAEGSTVSRAASPDTFEVTGTAAFGEPVPSTKTFFVRRKGCGGGADNTTYLSVRTGTDPGDGCGDLTNTFQEVSETYAAEDGVPFQVNPAGKVDVQVTTNGFAGPSVGQQTVSVNLTGNTASGGFGSLFSGSKTFLILPTQSQVVTTFEGEVDDALAGETFTDLSLTITYSAGSVMWGFTQMNGDSWVKVPILDAGTVEVALDSSTFVASRTVVATLDPDGTWAAEVATPAAGVHRLYARATQTGQVAVKTGPVSFTVTN